MRITFVTTQLDLVNGGGSNFDRMIKARELTKRGAEVRFITVFSYKNNLISLPYKVIEENVYPTKLKFFAFHKAVADIMKKHENETDIYYVDGHVFWFAAGLYKSRGGKPVMAHIEHYHFPTGLMPVSFFKKIKLAGLKLFEKYCLSYWTKKIDLFVPVSPVTRDLYAERGIPKSHFLVLPDFIDYSIFTIKNKFVCPQKAHFHIIYSGRLIKERNADLIIEALAILKDLDICLDIVGSGPEKDNLIKLAKERAVEDRVFWHGRIEHENMGDIFKHSSLLILTSLWKDALGMAAIEALGCGVPVIVPAGTGDEWGAGDAGLSYEIGNAEDLADKIQTIYRDPNLRQRMSENGIKRGKDIFDHQKLTEILYKRMQQLIQ
ncbi:MAG: glycosyltransferase family 4 protein [Patescibacteria group bacterium]